jgi:hypothetical protein
VVATGRLGGRLGGARIGLASAAAFVALPPAGSLYFVDSYDTTWSHEVVPHLLGLRGTLQYLLMVALAVGAATLARNVLAFGGLVALVVAFSAWSIGAVGDLRNAVHESGWSVALLEWLPLAGALGAILRSRRLGFAVSAWFAVVLLRAAGRPYADGEFWIALGPALPAAAVLLASIGLLLPPLRERSAAVPTN